MGEEEKDVLSQIKGIVEGREKSEQARLKELLETLVMRGLAARVFLERKAYEGGLSPEEAKRVGLQEGKPISILEPLDIFILPLEEDQGSHLVIDIRRGLEIYRMRPWIENDPIIKKNYRKAFEEVFLGNNHIMVGKFSSEKGNRLKVLPFGHSLFKPTVKGERLLFEAERFTYSNELELEGLIEKAVEVGMEIKRKEEEFRRRATRTLIDKLSSLVENVGGETGADSTPLQE